ncbi:hypothetical protein KA183_16715 [bacterium]|nr:hypothetical protein [bacterium]
MSLETIFWSAFLLPLLGALCAGLFSRSSLSGICAIVSSWMSLILLTYVLLPFLQSDKTVLFFSSLIVCSKLSAAFLLLTVLVVATALTQSYLFFQNEFKDGKLHQQKHICWFYSFSLLFLLAMMSVFVSENLGTLWISVEATSLLSAGLVYFSRTNHAIEATWKYLIICSVGIAFALLGTIFIFASSQYGAVEGGSLSFAILEAKSALLQPLLLKLGFIFCLVGYGTKSGVFPLHSWLPDAHSEAPAPASAMLSASLLNCALFAIFKVLKITNLSSCGISCDRACLWAGVITVLAASFFLIKQHGLKRLWAYSSIENVGLMMVAIGLGSAPIFFLQALNHSIVKVSLFCTAGNIIQICGTKELSHISGLLKISPLNAALLLLGGLAVTGTPPFGTFISEWMLLSLSVERHFSVVAVIILVSLTIAFIAIIYHIGRMLIGNVRIEKTNITSIKYCAIPLLLIIVSVALCFVIRPELLGEIK